MNKNLNLELIVAGFPGWHGITRREWPRRTKGDRSCFFVCLFVFGARVYSRAAVMVFFRAELTKGTTLIKHWLNINRVRVEVDCKIVCRRNRQSLGSSDVLLSCFSNTWHGSFEPAAEGDFPHLLELTLSSFYLNSFLHEPLSDHWFVPIQGKPGVRGLPGPRGLPGLEVSLWYMTHNRTTIMHQRHAALHKALCFCLLSIFLLKSVSSDFRGMKAQLDHQAFQDLRWIKA